MASIAQGAETGFHIGVYHARMPVAHEGEYLAPAIRRAKDVEDTCMV